MRGLAIPALTQHIGEHFERQYRTDPQSLAIARILYASYIIAERFPIATELIGKPANAYKPPPGLPELFGGLPSPPLIVAINALVLLLAGMVLIGWRTRAASLGLGVALMVAFAMKFSTGKINHNIVFVLVPCAMALSNWGACYSLDAKRYLARPDAAKARASDWSARALVLLALAMGLAFASAGFLKARSGWLDTGTSATLGHAVRNVITTGRDPLLFDGLMRVLPLWCWEALDYATVLFEVGFALAFVWRTLLRWFLVFAVGFHIGIYATLDIGFTSTMAGYLMFVSWAVILPGAFLAKLSAIPRVAALATACLFFTAAAANALLLDDQLIDALPGNTDEALIFATAAIIALVWAGSQVRRVIPPRVPSA